MDLCMKELNKELGRMRSDPHSVLQSTKWWTVVYKDAYCKPLHLPSAALGRMLGYVVYTKEDIGRPDTFEVVHAHVVYGESFPW